MTHRAYTVSELLENGMVFAGYVCTWVGIMYLVRLMFNMDLELNFIFPLVFALIPGSRKLLPFLATAILLIFLVVSLLEKVFFQ